MNVEDFLGHRSEGPTTATFALGSELHGAFGGVFGGAVSAACVMAARPLAPGRRPFSAHVTFVRGLATPTCRSSAEVVSAGRTATTVSVELRDEADKLASRATVTFAANEALEDLSDDGAVRAPELRPYEEGTPVRTAPGFDPPIVKVIEPRLVGTPDGGYAHAVRVPWDIDDAGGVAEAVCMAADFCVGLPVGAALRGEPIAIPNPDLSLRFVGEELAEILVAVGRLGRIDRGAAATEIEVWAGGRLLALGLSSAVLLARRS